MQVNDRIRKQLGSWIDLFIPLIESSAWDGIFAYLKKESQAGKKLIPKSDDLFRSFELCDRHKMKALVILMDPYPSMKDGVIIANGVPMDCSNTGVLQPSLEQWYQQMESDYLGFSPDMDMRPDISYLLKEEHVMLLNSALSVELGKVGIHQQLWMSFMQYYIEEIINKYYKGLPIVLCGQSAQKLEKYINPLLHYVKKIEHPAAAAHSNRSWAHQDMFKWVNNIIRENNGEQYQIQWYRKKGDNDPVPREVQEWINDKGETDMGDLPWEK
jgi:uracil-DNA glycosylase